MDEKAGLRVLDSYSDNRKSKTCTELSRSIQNLAKDILNFGIKRRSEKTVSRAKHALSDVEGTQRRQGSEK
jgi:hypothetical protein